MFTNTWWQRRSGSKVSFIWNTIFDIHKSNTTPRNVETENLYQFDDELLLDGEGNIIGKWEDDEVDDEDENISEYANF